MTDTERASYWFDRAGQLLASLSEAPGDLASILTSILMASVTCQADYDSTWATQDLVAVR